MNKDRDAAKTTDDSRRPRRRGSRGIRRMINGVLAGIGALYLATHSVVVTVIGAALAVVLVVLHRITRR